MTAASLRSPNEEMVWDAIESLQAQIAELQRDLALSKLPVIGECEDCGHKVVTPLKRHAGDEERQ